MFSDRASNIKKMGIIMSNAHIIANFFGTVNSV
jgi:hypothetical protein